MACAPAFRRLMGGSAGAGRITPGLRIPRGSKARFTRAKSATISVAVDAREQARPAAVRRRARPTACRRAAPRASVTSSSSAATAASQPASVPARGSRLTCTWPSPAWPKITTGSPRAAARSAHGADVLAHLGSTGTQPSSITWSERRSSGSPARIGLAAWRSAQSRSCRVGGEAGVHRGGPRSHGRRGARPPPRAPRPGRRARSPPAATASSAALAHELEEGAVEQLDRRRLDAEAAPRRRPRARRATVARRGGRRARRDRVQPPLDRGHERRACPRRRSRDRAGRRTRARRRGRSPRSSSGCGGTARGSSSAAARMAGAAPSSNAPDRARGPAAGRAAARDASPSAVTSSTRLDPPAHAAVAHGAGAGGVGGDASRRAWPTLRSRDRAEAGGRRGRLRGSDRPT